MVGGTDNDLLSGQTGNDVLRGGQGEDTLFLNYGSDRAIGGADSDTFKINTTVEAPVIVDFDVTEDKLDILHYGTGESAQDALDRYGSVIDGNAVLELRGGATVTLLGIDDLSLLTDRFV